MHIEITKDFYEQNLDPKLSEDSPIREAIRKASGYGSTDFNLYMDRLSLAEIDLIYDIAKEKGNKSLQSKITAFRSLLKDVTGAKVSSLSALVLGIQAYLRQDLIDGWIYKMEDGVPYPYLVTSVKYESGGSRSDNKPYVAMHLVANSGLGNKEGVYKTSISFDGNDIQKKTIPEILASGGYFHETEELKAIYTEHVALFKQYQPRFNEQFVANGIGQDSKTWRNNIELHDAKVVNDELIIRRRFTENADPSHWRELGQKDKFDEIPFHSEIYMFNLSTHENMWVHAAQMEPYVYDESLRDKLVLPQDHRDLIDILVEDMDILQEDIIKGKSGGTTILCAGAPGLGKTLSAEVYSEIMKRPLYRVHSGQLGLSADEVEKNLEKILKRAARWKAVLLIDEADVYIRQRGNDLDQNAVVAAFLRTLEYFSGLLFLTTNRGEDVDDAILSRCIAVIKYKTPSADAARRIWKVLSTQFQVELSDNLIDQLVDGFKEASGRDIKELLKLTSRYAKGKNTPLDYETFRKCAQFRGII